MLLFCTWTHLINRILETFGASIETAAANACLEGWKREQRCLTDLYNAVQRLKKVTDDVSVRRLKEEVESASELMGSSHPDVAAAADFLEQAETLLKLRAAHVSGLPFLASVDFPLLSAVHSGIAA